MALLPRLVLLPGIGIDGGVFAPQRTLRARVEVPACPRFDVGESMGQYARRVGETFDTREPFFLGGVSFGAMLAMEMSAHLSPLAVFSIGGCRSGDELAGPMRLMARVVPHVSDAAVCGAVYFAPLLVRLVGKPDRRQRRLLVALAERADPWHVRHGAAALARWRFEGTPRCAIYEIHGEEDRIVPVSKTRRPDLLIRDAGHIVSVTHAGVVNAFMEGVMGERMGRAPSP